MILIQSHDYRFGVEVTVTDSGDRPNAAVSKIKAALDEIPAHKVASVHRYLLSPKDGADDQTLADCNKVSAEGLIADRNGDFLISAVALVAL